MSAKSVVSRFLSAEIESTKLPSGYSDSIESVQSKFKKIFKKDLGPIEWRTSRHPDFKTDMPSGKQDAEGFVLTKSGKKIVYLNLEKFKSNYMAFVAHELGHILDKELGGGSYFSESVKDVPPLKDTPREAFAMMVDFMINTRHPGGPGQTALYKAVCDKLGIKPAC